jgi:indolepyruvate ferredoxin oxidoreductase, alpha subunit
LAKALLSGNEAIGLGAYHAGVSVAAAYPGTPSTEILEVMADYSDLHAEWAPNEKVALEVGLGASYAGVRSMVSMKHVGLNVAADPFFAASITGINGGFVVVAADDPGMHSSQNEQDNRHYARFAKLPVLEPSDSQEAYEFARLAFSLSEQFDTPVMLRPTTRVSHSKSIVRYDEGIIPDRLVAPAFVRRPEKYVMIPANARKRHPAVEDRIARLAEYAETFPHNRVELGDSSIGIISAGVAYQYAREVMPAASFLKLGMGYPLPAEMIRRFAAQVSRLVVVEELDPFIEDTVRALGLSVEGKKYFSPVGELSLERVEQGFRELGLLRERPAISHQLTALSSQPSAVSHANSEPITHHSSLITRDPEPVPLPSRPPVLCPGCPHTGPFFVLRKLGFYRKAGDVVQTLPGQILAKLKRSGVVVAGDIGCYTLGVLPPLLAIDTCGCMGASIGNATGMEKAGLPNRVVAVIGDSTFLHSGIAPLLNVVYNGGTITTIILDNSTTAMTGHQDHPGTGKSAQGAPARSVDLESLVRALGVEDVKVVSAFDLEALTAALRDSVERDEPSVVIVRGSCALKVRAAGEAYRVDPEKCDGCGACLRTGCAAIVRRDRKAEIQQGICVGTACGVCSQVCPRHAIGAPVAADGGRVSPNGGPM